MGSSSSKKSTGPGHPQKIRSPDHGPLPLETVPYNGPLVQYRIVEMNVNFTPHVQFGLMAHGGSQMTTNVDDYYPTLGNNYGEGFVLVTFYKIPGGMQRQGLFSMNVAVPFQGIFIRYPSVPTEERWQLRIEKSVMYVQAMTSMRILSGSASQSSANTSHLIDMIANCTSSGGRLVCVELTGTQSSQVMQMGFTGGAVTSGLGVDLFFNMPLHPNPRMYTYQCVSTPIPMTMQAGFGQVNVDIQFNFMAQLGAYLNQGYRLVEIFYDCSSVMQTQGMITPMAGMSMNSIWFFEKEASRVNDNTPVYEGCIVEYYLKIQANFTGTTSRANWAPLLEVMGTKGWELACTLETPKMVRSGMMTFKQTVLLFFQRPLSHPAAGTPLGLVDPATGEPMGPQASEWHPPPSYDSVVGK